MDNNININATKVEFDMIINNSCRRPWYGGMPVIVVETDGVKQLYAIGRSFEEKTKALLSYIEEKCGDIDPEILAHCSGIDEEVFTTLQAHPDCPTSLVASVLAHCVGNTKNTHGFEYVEMRASTHYGYGMFLAPYDKKEIKLACGYTAYRIE